MTIPANHDIEEDQGQQVPPHEHHHNIQDGFKHMLRSISQISFKPVLRKFSSHYSTDVEVKRPVYTLDYFDTEYGYEHRGKSLQEKLKLKAKKQCTCSKQRLLGILVSFFPILKWFPEWLKDWKLNAVADLLVGLTVGIMSIPQGMAYTRLAGLNPIYGLYTNLIPTIIYVFLGTAKHAAIGTVAVLSLMMGALRYKLLPYEDLDGPPMSKPSNNSSSDSLLSTTAPTHYDFTPIELAVSTSLFIGVILLIMGLLRLGFVSAYLSDQLVGGFTSGAAIHVFTSQVDAIFGLKIPKHDGPLKIFYTYIDLFKNITHTNIAALVISIVAIIFLLLCKEFLDKFVQRKFRVPIPSELIVVIVGTIISALVNFHDRYDVKTVGEIKAGFPIPTAPRVDIWSKIVVEAIILAIVCFCLSVSLAKLYAKKHNYKIDAYQEFFAYSAINIVGSFFQCFPSGQSVARSIVYDGAGAKSQIAGLIGSILVIFVILWIAPYLSALPQCCLGSIIVVACIEMLHQMKELKNLWRTSKIDFSIYIVTFLAVVILDVTYGLAVSVLYAFLTVIFRTQCPNVRLMGHVPDTDLYGEVEGYSKVQQMPGLRVFHFNAPLYYANVENFKPKLYKRCNVDLQAMRASQVPPPAPVVGKKSQKVVVPPVPIVPDGIKIPYCVVIDCSGFSYIDLMGVNVLKQVYLELQEVGIEVFYAACNPGVRKMLQKVELYNTVPKKRFFVTLHDAVVAALKYVKRTKKESVSPHMHDVLDLVIESLVDKPGSVADFKKYEELFNDVDDDNETGFNSSSTIPEHHILTPITEQLPPAFEDAVTDSGWGSSSNASIEKPSSSEKETHHRKVAFVTQVSTGSNH